MTGVNGLRYYAFATIALIGLCAGVLANPQPANAVVYCTSVGVPKGCVVRPVNTVAVTRDRGAPGVGVRAGTPANRGGPVNRVGRR